jgi:hypothetical protein
VAWQAVDGPRLAETITLRPMGETRTQIVAQLDADAGFLLPSDRHAQATLSRRLKADLNAFKGLIETGKLGETGGLSGASSKNMTGSAFASPASVAARIRNRPKPGAGWGTSAAERSNGSDADLPYHGMTEADMGTSVDITSAPGIGSTHDLDDVLAPGRRIAKAGPISGGAAGTAEMGGTTEMGGRTAHEDVWGEGTVNEEDRGSPHDMRPRTGRRRPRSATTMGTSVRSGPPPASRSTARRAGASARSGPFRRWPRPGAAR